MKNIVIREIKGIDWRLVARLERLEKRNLGRRVSINRWVIPVIIRYGKFIVAQKSKNDSDIIGVCELIKSWKDKNTAFIHSFYIDKGYRKKGVGKKLLQKVIDILKNDGFKEIELTVDPGNDAAGRLYKNFDFKKIGLRKSEYGLGVDRDLMKLEL